MEQRHEQATSNVRGETYPDLVKCGLQYVETEQDAKLTELGEERAKEKGQLMLANVSEGMPLPDRRAIFASSCSRAVQTGLATFGPVYDSSIALNITRDFAERSHCNYCDKGSTITQLRKSFGDSIRVPFDMPEHDEKYECWPCRNESAIRRGITQRHPKADVMRPNFDIFPSLRKTDCLVTGEDWMMQWII
ncbi:hypothetical protein BD324DRAFT_173782 [Kockovaella imperatae]|uniref:Uncharacterized protein n=1 Tax=Kockovaella imperatae TaxID=4999 RepID=A0A1Y1U878_9TREE|nr:hypothetical protein BD324DRAFT_173782 [Kockovaella imperatae]ORX34240.1 hypothetical protein BD324DRAFT_173782 [Kockovaella imperatae]